MMEKEKEDLMKEIEFLKESNKILKNELDDRLHEIYRMRVGQPLHTQIIFSRHDYITTVHKLLSVFLNLLFIGTCLCKVVISVSLCELLAISPKFQIKIK